MKFISILLGVFVLAMGKNNEVCNIIEKPVDGCIQFSVSSGTGCAWMCNYCANQLGTNNYYFTDNVCTYVQGEGCQGNPIAGKLYTCCAA